jgi:LysM repeat protein
MLFLLALLVNPSALVSGPQPVSGQSQSSDVTAFDLIIAMNTLRVSNGLPALVEDPIIDAVAQATAETMAASQMSWHIGNVSGRLAAAGYGGGAKVWATENFAVNYHASIDQIMLVWSDASHMIPAVNSAYCNIGAGVAKAANGSTYYVLQAAYTSGKSCGEYKSPKGTKVSSGGSTSAGISQWIVPVKIATPDAEGRVYHVVQPGQSFWSIAIAYKITIKDLETWNNLSSNSKLQIGQRLFIPGSNTEGYATPTPVGMVLVSKPDQDGKIIHEVQAYQTLSTISQAYGVPVQTILNLNGLQIDWPLQIGQKLLIDPGHVTPSPTPRPLTPLEKLTPESDGKYYHVVQSGETLSWIAGLYEIQLAELMAWNGLNAASILHPGEKLLLQVTPPATETPTPRPATFTYTARSASPSPSSTLTPSETAVLTTTPVEMSVMDGKTAAVWIIYISLAASILFLAIFFLTKRRE